MWRKNKSKSEKIRLILGIRKSLVYSGSWSHGEPNSFTFCYLPQASINKVFQVRKPGKNNSFRLQSVPIIKLITNSEPEVGFFNLFR